MWIVEYYETVTGLCPTKEFLDLRDKQRELPAIMHDIDRLAEYGFKLKRPYVDTLRDGIHELRTRVGTIQYRLLYFFFYNEKIIITNGTSKKKKIPPSEIDKALRYKEDYYSRNERKT